MTNAPVACDFCVFFNFNGDTLTDPKTGEKLRNAIYTDQGWCRLHARRTDPGDSCDEFKLDPLLEKK